AEPVQIADPKRRVEFVGMMFAIVVAEIGVQAAELAKTGLPDAHQIYYALPAISHLLLATVLVAASWVGWKASEAPGGRTDATEVLTWPFTILVLDVLLV